MNDKILVIGSGGQVATALKSSLGSRAIVAGRNLFDLSRPSELRARVLEARPDVVINAAAYTAVDKAESERELAFAVNALAPLEIAKACHEIGARFVTYSTDYVYSGLGVQPWRESDPVAPQNVYGETKAAGEKLLAEWAPSDFRYVVLRTSWIYSNVGKNFLLTMLKLGAEREELKIVNDQIGAPTYADHLARATVDILPKMTPSQSGIYNCAGGCETSWHGFAQEIFEMARQRGLPLKVKNCLGIPTSAYPTPARRPLNSRLNQDKLDQHFAVRLPDWTLGLQECFGHIK